MNALLGDDAYALAEEAPVELRVLYGAQAGSRLSLSVGEYSIGRGDGCTLILEGSGIEDCHAQLRFDGETVWIDPVDGLVRSARGDDVDGELALGLPVQLGTVWISVDREDAPWPDTGSVMPIGIRKETEAERSVTADPADQADAAAPAIEAAMDTPDFAPAPPGKKRWTVVLLAILALTAGCFGMFSLFQANQGKRVADLPAQQMETAPHQVLQAPQAALDLIKDYPGTAITLQHENGQDRWLVGGYVAKADQLRELSSMLASVAPSVQVKVLAEEDLVQKARQILSAEAAAAHVRVDNAAGGVLQLAGAATTAGDIGQIEAKLLAGVPGISSVKAHILLPDQLRKTLRERLAAASLGDRLTISSDAPEMTLSGRLTMEEIRRWEDLLVAFNREYGNVLPIRATVTRLIPKPPVGVQAIVGGAVPYIVTQAGEHVNQGGDVNGHTLISVKDGEVVFEGRQRVRIAR